MYGKLFASMFRGSLYGKWQAIITFQQMIILADQYGTVDFTPEALAATTSIPLDIIKEGIQILESPDDTSRSPDESGRRIIPLDPSRSWGWHIVNYSKYRAIRSAEERRAYHRQYWHTRDSNQSQPDSTTTQQSQPIVEAVSSKHKQETTLSGKQPDSIDIDAIHKTNGRNYRQEAIEVLEFLNTKTGRKYRPVDPTVKPIMARLKTCTVQDMKTVIARKHREWNANEKMEKYLRPKTLFAAANFENYLGECVLKP